MWQDILTAVIVAVAALALLWRWLPQRWRARAARVHPALAPMARPAAVAGAAMPAPETAARRHASPEAGTARSRA